MLLRASTSGFSSRAGAPMQVTRVDQIAIAVPDLDEALAFYERAFGLVPEYRERVDSDGVEEAMLDVGGVWLQLLQPTRDDSPIAKYLAKNGPGLHHLGFGVASVGDALDHLRDQDVRLIDEEPRPGGGGHTVAFVHPKGTGGVLVELVEDDAH
ncbi:methylmalonyl-CoA epimerase [Egicoccus halophilus]|uniref:Methylmalonyl-CoA epimerase n=2 Tax=Egicoccus halophilus TaxID=1670830 RepID=A0A8J3ACE4_9ACTN|nr:methylmalonyl-CoA epimerase [Egicoccus halophilus]